jgi:hypothetical protein
MKYQIDDNYSITGNSNSFMLKFESTETNEKGEPVTTTDRWYYPSLKLSLMSYVDKCTLACNTPKEILSKLEECLKIVKDFKC